VTGKRGNIGSVSPEIANLKGVRYAVMQESSVSDEINEGPMKELTGGDAIQSRALYKAPTTFIPQFKLAMATNNLPAIKGKDEQLVEGYSFLSKKQLKEYASLLKRIVEDCARIAHTAKLTRAPRKKKVKSVDKVIEKLQFKKEDNEYKAASINPADIIGASQLWVFNTKTRKNGFYNSTDVGGLNIKGTTLTNFNEETSVQKTIRKPEVVLPATLKAGKVALRKVLTDINAVEQALTGRVNSDIILLRVIK
jgi:hypothetical protein